MAIHRAAAPAYRFAHAGYGRTARHDHRGSQLAGVIRQQSMLGDATIVEGNRRAIVLEPLFFE
jgi:hypothetical protein